MAAGAVAARLPHGRQNGNGSAPNGYRHKPVSFMHCLPLRLTSEKGVESPLRSNRFSTSLKAYLSALLTQRDRTGTRVLAPALGSRLNTFASTPSDPPTGACRSSHLGYRLLSKGPGTASFFSQTYPPILQRKTTADGNPQPCSFLVLLHSPGEREQASSSAYWPHTWQVSSASLHFPS